jgi:DNA modification methylase
VDDRTQSTVIDDTQSLEKMKKEELVEILKKIMDNQQSTVLYENKPLKSDLHPTMKPIPLIGKLIKNSSIKGQLVYEPFAGSGSTLIAADQLERTCYAMELDPRYVDVIVTRWEELTQRIATRIQ